MASVAPLCPNPEGLKGNGGASQSRITTAPIGGAVTIHDAAAFHESEKSWRGQRGGGPDIFFVYSVNLSSGVWCRKELSAGLQPLSPALCLLHPSPSNGELQSSRPSGTQATKAAVYVQMHAASRGTRALHTGRWAGTTAWNQALDVVWGLVTVMG